MTSLEYIFLLLSEDIFEFDSKNKDFKGENLQEFVVMDI